MNFFVAVLFISATVFVSCGAKQVVAHNNSGKTGGNPFGSTYEMPCQVYDTPQEFAATTAYRGSKNKMENIRWSALQNAQELIKLKMQRSYDGLFSTYANSYGNNKGNDVEDKMERACDDALKGILNNTSETCLRWGEVDEDGHVYCYIAIKVSKEELAEKASKQVQKLLTEDEKTRIDFREDEFRKKLNDRFEKFKDEKEK